MTDWHAINTNKLAQGQRVRATGLRNDTQLVFIIAEIKPGGLVAGPDWVLYPFDYSWEIDLAAMLPQEITLPDKENSELVLHAIPSETTVTFHTSYYNDRWTKVELDQDQVGQLVRWLTEWENFDPETGRARE